MTYPARSPLPGEEEAGGATTGDGVGDDLKRLTVRLPADVVEQLSSAAHGEGTSRGLLVRRLLEAGLRHPPGPEQAVVLPGGTGRPTLVHEGDLREAGDGVEIPDGYTAPPEATPRGRPAAVEDKHAPRRRGRRPGGRPALRGGEAKGAGCHPTRPRSGGARPLRRRPSGAAAAAPASGRVYRFALLAVLAAGVAALLVGLLPQRYQLHAPDPGAYGAGAYLVDRWSGRVWFCDSAQRGLPVRVCAPFALGGLAPAPQAAAPAE